MKIYYRSGEGSQKNGSIFNGAIVTSMDPLRKIETELFILDCSVTWFGSWTLESSQYTDCICYAKLKRCAHVWIERPIGP